MLRLIMFACISICVSNAVAGDPLPSWNDGPTKHSIINFVDRVSTKGSSDYIPPAERIATFDNDGTLWSERPLYFQVMFALDRVKTMAADHPEWNEMEPFASVIKGDLKKALAGGEASLAKIIMATHANMTNAEFQTSVRNWIETAKHPKTGRPYSKMVYQPMLEVLTYLRSNGFKTYIVSGGGVEFMRVFTEEVYGIPPEQVVGSRIKLKYEVQEDGPVLMRLPEFEFVDDKTGKPVGIQTMIGRRPIAAFGNSDGDLQMLEWTAANKRLSFCLLVRHTDDVREWAYDRDSKIGRLDKALDVAMQQKWSIADMKAEWKVIYPWQVK